MLKPCCKKCNKQLSVKKSVTGFCRQCWILNNKGDNSPAWKGGKPKCECGKTIAYKSMRCKSCSAKLPNRLEKLVTMSKSNRGEKSYNWIVDRTKLKKDNRNDSAYKVWRMAVYKRDGFKCMIANGDCKGRIEAHHILRWSEHPELRYNINNGITLCQAHHPTKRMDEKIMAPVFKELVSLNK